MSKTFAAGDMVFKRGDKREWTIIELRPLSPQYVRAVLLRWRNTSAGFRPVKDIAFTDALRPAFTYKIRK